MTVIELEPITHEGLDFVFQEDEHRAPRPVHLYMHTILGMVAQRALCGTHASHDWHSQSHFEEAKRGMLSWDRGMLSCPICGAPICMDCLLQVS